MKYIRCYKFDPAGPRIIGSGPLHWFLGNVCSLINLHYALADMMTYNSA